MPVLQWSLKSMAHCCSDMGVRGELGGADCKASLCQAANGPAAGMHMRSARWLARVDTHLMTCTCALMTRVLLTVKPSSTLLSSMNFFQPQSCSFLQKRCKVSARTCTSALIWSTAREVQARGTPHLSPL